MSSKVKTIVEFVVWLIVVATKQEWLTGKKNIVAVLTYHTTSTTSTTSTASSYWTELTRGVIESIETYERDLDGQPTSKIGFENIPSPSQDLNSCFDILVILYVRVSI